MLRTRLKQKGSELPLFFSLVDSGTDSCMFPLAFAMWLGIVSEKDTPDSIASGAGGNVRVYYRDVTLEVRGIGEWPIYAGFYDEPQLMLGKLGQHGFFDHVRVQFDLPNKWFYVQRCDGPLGA
jgi:hypothetical protein